MAFHPREDFQWDIAVHDFPDNMIKTEDRICWNDYHRLLDQFDQNLSRNDTGSLPYIGSRIATVELQGISQISAMERKHGTQPGLNIFEYEQLLCSYCFEETFWAPDLEANEQRLLFSQEEVRLARRRIMQSFWEEF